MDEREEVSRAEMFIHSFDDILDLNKAAYQKALEIRFFKLHLLKRHLDGKIDINMPPTFLNHMVNEVEEALSILLFLQAGQVPPLQEALHHHLVWLQDAFGHSATISGKLDLVEKDLKETGDVFTKHFEAFYLKAVELAGYTRTGLRNFSALQRFNKQVELEMHLFMKFLGDKLSRFNLTICTRLLIHPSLCLPAVHK